MEATRKRLEALKAAEDDHSATLSEGAGPQKKKLSDVQVNSSIASTLAKNFNVVPKAAAATPTQASGPDLLAFDDSPPKAAASLPRDASALLRLINMSDALNNCWCGRKP